MKLPARIERQISGMSPSELLSLADRLDDAVAGKSIFALMAAPGIVRELRRRAALQQGASDHE